MLSPWNEEDWLNKSIWQSVSVQESYSRVPQS